MTDVDVRSRMLSVAEALVTQNGLTVSLDHIPVEEVIRQAGVSRSSAYRLWPYKQDFYIDLLCHLAGPTWQGTASYDHETVALVERLVAENRERIRTPDGRRWLLTEAVRRGVELNWKTLQESPQWRTYVAITATVVSLPAGEVRARIQAALEGAEQQFVSLMVGFYERMAAAVGLRMRVPYSFSTLATCGAAFVEGLGLRNVVSPTWVSQSYKVADDDGSREWSLAATAFLGIVDAFTEPDPDFDAEAVIKALEAS
jgi:AcrR family transcriptional regulator